MYLFTGRSKNYIVKDDERMKKWDIEVSEEMYEVLARVFQVIGLDAPAYMNAKEMEKVLVKMEKIVHSAREEFYEPSYNVPDSFRILNDKIKPFKKIKNTLIISRTGIIRYQLKATLNSYKVDVSTIDNQYRGLAEYVKRLHDLVVIDTSDNIDEIFDVVREIKRVSAANSIDTTIVVLVAPGEEEVRAKLLSRGVDKFFEKKGNWYEALVNDLKINESIAL
jgi:CheY-like chemotaxis protein